MKKYKFPLIFAGCIVILAGCVLLSFYLNRARPLEAQIADMLNVNAEDIELFGSFTSFQEQVFGFTDNSELYGLIQTDLSETPKIKYLWTSDDLPERADRVWFQSISTGTGIFYIFLSANEDLDKIVWVAGDQRTEYPVDRPPTIIPVNLSGGTIRYFLLDEDGNELP